LKRNNNRLNSKAESGDRYPGNQQANTHAKRRDIQLKTTTGKHKGKIQINHT
jgi:hypothetical protein